MINSVSTCPHLGANNSPLDTSLEPLKTQNLNPLLAFNGTTRSVEESLTDPSSKIKSSNSPIVEQPLAHRNSKEFTDLMHMRVQHAIEDSGKCCPNWWTAICDWWKEPNPVEPEPIATQSESTFGVSDCCSEVLSSCFFSGCNTATTACSSCCNLMQQTAANEQATSAWRNTYKPCCESSASCCISTCSSCTKNCLDTVRACWRCWTGSKTARTIESEFSARYFMATDGTTQTLTSQQRQQLLTGIETDLGWLLTTLEQIGHKLIIFKEPNWHVLMEATVRMHAALVTLGDERSGVLTLIEGIWDHSLDGSNENSDELKEKLQRVVRQLKV